MALKSKLLFLLVFLFSCANNNLTSKLSDSIEKDITSKYSKEDVAFLYLEDEVGSLTAEAIIEGIEEANQRGKDAIVITINSPGGSVGHGLQIIDAIESSDVKVVCHVRRMAASMAAALLQSCDERVMEKRAMIMLHEPSVGGAGGKSDDLQQEVDFMKVLSRMLVEQYALKSKISADEIEQKIKHYDWYMSWKEAVELGFVDRAV